MKLKLRNCLVNMPLYKNETETKELFGEYAIIQKMKLKPKYCLVDMP